MLKDAFARLGKHTAVYAVAGQLTRVVGFLLIPLYTDWLSTGDYGVKELLDAMLTVLTYVVGINLTNAMVRWYFDEQDPKDRNAAISTTLITLAGAGVLVGGAIALFSEVIGNYFDPGRPDAGELVRVVLGILVLNVVRETWFRYLQAEERSVVYATVSLCQVTVQILLQVWFVVGLDMGLAGVFYGVLYGEAGAVAVLSLMLLPKVGIRFSPRLFSAMMVFTLPLIPNGLLQFGLHSADRFLLRGLADTDALGIYGFAYKLGYIPNLLLLTPFLMIWYPYVFSLKDEAKQKDVISRLMPYFMFALTAIVFLLVLLAENLANLMAGRPEYVPGWPAIILVCVGYWFWAAFQIVQTGFYVTKKTGWLPVLTGAAVLINVGANLVLIPRHGWLGAAWATLLTFVVLLAISVRAVRPVFLVDYPWRRVLVPAAGSAVIAAGALWALPLAATDPLSWAVKIGLFAVWLAWMWGGGFLTRDERAAVVDLVRARTGRGDG